MKFPFRIPGPYVLIASVLLVGCAKEGTFSREQPKDEVKSKPSTEIPDPNAVQHFMFLPPDGTYHYSLKTVSSPGSTNTHTVELQFALTLTKHADRFTGVTTIEQRLVDGKPDPTVTPAMIKAFKITSTLDPHGKIESSKAAGTDGLAAPDVKDLGETFVFPMKALRPGDSWDEQREGYTVTFKFTGLAPGHNRTVAMFEERASAANGAKVDQPTMINVDAKTGVLVGKAADAIIPDPNAPDKLIRSHSELGLRE